MVTHTFHFMEQMLLCCWGCNILSTSSLVWAGGMQCFLTLISLHLKPDFLRKWSLWYPTLDSCPWMLGVHLLGHHSPIFFFFQSSRVCFNGMGENPVSFPPQMTSCRRLIHNTNSWVWRNWADPALSPKPLLENERDKGRKHQKSARLSSAPAKDKRPSQF